MTRSQLVAVLVTLAFAACSAPAEKPPATGESQPTQRQESASEGTVGERRPPAEAPSPDAVEFILPAEAEAAADPDTTSLVIRIEASGALVANGAPVTLEDLDQLFQAAHARDVDTRVILAVVPEARHGRVVEVMDAAKRHGLRRIAIATPKE